MLGRKSTLVIDDKMLKRSYWFFILFYSSLFLGAPLFLLLPAWVWDVFYLGLSLVGVVWQVRILGSYRRKAIPWLIAAAYLLIALVAVHDLWGAGWRLEQHSSDLPRHGSASSLGGPSTSLYVIGVVLSVLLLYYSRLDRRSDPNESPKSKFGRRLFYAFTATQLASVLLIAFTLVVAIHVYDMPLDWERMHRFWKRARLVSPAVFSLLLCFLGAPLAALALVFRFRIRDAIAAALMLGGNFLLQMGFVYHLVD